jgi:hypothetical protein
VSRHFRGHRWRVQPTAEALKWLREDYPARLKQVIFLASKGAMHGPRQCLLCPRVGVGTRVYVPDIARRVEQPDLSAVQAYWVCSAHSGEAIPDEELPRLLAARRQARR